MWDKRIATPTKSAAWVFTDYSMAARVVKVAVQQCAPDVLGNAVHRWVHPPTDVLQINGQIMWPKSAWRRVHNAHNQPCTPFIMSGQLTPAPAPAPAPAASRPVMPTFPKLGMPHSKYIAVSYHPMTATELVRVRSHHSLPTAFVGNTMEAEEIVDAIIRTATTAPCSIACLTPKACWKMNVVHELRVQMCDSGLEFESHPWSESTSWKDVADAAGCLGVNLFAGLDGVDNEVIDRMEIFNLQELRAKQDSERAKVNTKMLEWDEEHAEVHIAGYTTWEQRDQTLRKSAVDLTSN